MSLIKYRECVAIVWDGQNRISGVKAKVTKEKTISVVKTVSSGEGVVNFQESLAEAHKKLAPSENQIVVIGCDIPGCVFLELSIPRMPASELTNAIKYELPRHIPYNIDELAWEYRILPEEASDGKQKPYRVRVMAVVDKNWNTLVSEISNSGLKIDAFTHPLMAIDPFLRDVDVHMPSIDPDFIFRRRPGDGARVMAKADSVEAGMAGFGLSDSALFEELRLKWTPPEDNPSAKIEDFLPCLLVTAYCLSEHFDDDAGSRLALPKEVMPQRFSGIRTFCIMLAVFAVVFSFGYLGRSWWDGKKRLNELNSEIARVKTLTRNLDKENSSKQALNDLIQQVESAEVGNHDLIASLHELTKQIPKEIWIINFTSNGNIIDLTMQEAKDSDNDLSRLKFKYFTFTITSKKKNADGTTNISAKAICKSSAPPPKQEESSKKSKPSASTKTATGAKKEATQKKGQK